MTRMVYGRRNLDSSQRDFEAPPPTLDESATERTEARNTHVSLCYQIAYERTVRILRIIMGDYCSYQNTKLNLLRYRMALFHINRLQERKLAIT
jgi:hypothetical protein